MRFVFSAVIAAALVAGCATTPPPVGGDAALTASPTEILGISETDGSSPALAASAPIAAPAAPEAASVVAGSVSAATNSPSAKTATVKTPEPKPWKIELADGSHVASVDGVRMYLGFPALPAKKGKKPVASPDDWKLSLVPLLKARSKPLVSGRPLRVCIDAGHGGEDSGALSRDGKTLEKTVALDLARRVRKMLVADGAEVLLTRSSDSTFVKLEDRAARAKKWKADVFVSLHLNANAKAAPRGVETYALPFRGAESTAWDGKKRTAESQQTFSGNSHDVGNIQLAFCLQRRLCAASKLPDRGVKRARFVVLREAGMPAALVECGFLTNGQDLGLLRTTAGRDSVAKGVYEGICDFAIGTMAPGLPAHVSGTGGLGRDSSATEATAAQPAPAAPATPAKQPAPTAQATPGSAPSSRAVPVSFVRGGDSRVAPYSAPALSGGGAATEAARAAALKAAGL